MLGTSWMDPIKHYLRNSALLNDVDEAIKIKRKAFSYILDDDDLYRVRGGEMTLICIDRSEALKVINELHEGICESYNGGQTMAHRVMSMAIFIHTS